MGFPATYVLPTRYNDAYKLAGDGVAVPVVRHPQASRSGVVGIAQPDYFRDDRRVACLQITDEPALAPALAIVQPDALVGHGRNNRRTSAESTDRLVATVRRRCPSAGEVVPPLHCSAAIDADDPVPSAPARRQPRRLALDLPPAPIGSYFLETA